VTRSPIYSKFSEALQGVATIRAYGKGAYFTMASDRHMEVQGGLGGGRGCQGFRGGRARAWEACPEQHPLGGAKTLCKALS
jgi:hypothetical protein